MTDDIQPPEEESGESGNGVGPAKLMQRGWFRAAAASVLAAVVLAAVLLAVLPGGGSKPAQKAQATAKVGGSPASTSTKTTVKSNLPTTLKPGETSLSAAAAKAWMDQATAAGATASYIATYQVTRGSQNMQFTYAQQGSQTRTIMSQGGLDMEVFTSGSNAYNCFYRTSPSGSSPLPIEAGKWLCEQQSAAASTGSSLTTIGQDFVKQVQSIVSHEVAIANKYKGLPNLMAKSSMTVAGIPLSCLNVPPAGIQLCFTSGGVVGYMSQATQGGGTMQLTAFSTTIPAGEFTLPATPIPTNLVPPNPPSPSGTSGSSG